MQGGGDNGRRMQIDGEQLTPLSARSSAPSPLALQHVDQNPFSRGELLNGPQHQQQIEFTIAHSKKLQDDTQELGQRIKHHEDNVKYLKSLNTQIDDQILDMQVALGKLHLSKENRDFAPSESEEEIKKRILEHERSAAAFLCRLLSLPDAKIADHSLTKDVFGIVATLGKVDDGNLSRILSEYLGLETMMAVVCRTSEGLKALEAYNKDGSVNKNFGLHAFANCTGMPLDGRFRVYCLENLRPYGGGCIEDDLQRRLDLVKPKLHGKTPHGFLGFAVNMISVDNSKLYCVTKAGNNLRETLLYDLFSSLQVYETREDIQRALPVIHNGAISLDGGIVRGTGSSTLGLQSGDVDVKFPSGSIGGLPQNYVEIGNKMKEAKWKKSRTLDDLQREQELLQRAKVIYEAKKQEFVDFLAKSSPYATQGGRASTPRASTTRASTPR